MTSRAVCALVACVLSSLACASLPAPGTTDPVALRYRQLDGTSATLTALHGKVVIVTVFNTWAAPALLEVPRFKALALEHPTELVIVALALDPHIEAVRIFAETFEVPYVVGQPFDAAELVGSRGPFGQISIIPTSVVLDRSGQIVMRSDGTFSPDVLKGAIKRLLAADPSSQ